MGNLRADEQEPHRRPTHSGELAQQSGTGWFACGVNAAVVQGSIVQLPGSPSPFRLRRVLRGGHKSGTCPA